jgi:hypothetical protein
MAERQRCGPSGRRRCGFLARVATACNWTRCQEQPSWSFKLHRASIRSHNRRLQRTAPARVPKHARHSAAARFGRTDKTKNTDHSNEEPIASGCSAHRGRLHHVGIRFARRGSLGRLHAVGVGFGRRGNSGHEPSVRPRVVVGPWGCPIRSASGSHVVALSRRRVSGVRRDGRAMSMPAGLFNACAIIRSSLSLTRVVGLVSNGVLRSPE